MKKICIHKYTFSGIAHDRGCKIGRETEWDCYIFTHELIVRWNLGYTFEIIPVWIRATLIDYIQLNCLNSILQSRIIEFNRDKHLSDNK